MFYSLWHNANYLGVFAPLNVCECYDPKENKAVQNSLLGHGNVGTELSSFTGETKKQGPRAKIMIKKIKIEGQRKIWVLWDRITGYT